MSLGSTRPVIVETSSFFSNQRHHTLPTFVLTALCHILSAQTDLPIALQQAKHESHRQGPRQSISYTKLQSIRWSHVGARAPGASVPVAVAFLSGPGGKKSGKYVCKPISN